MKFEAKKGNRIKKRFYGITNFSGMWWLFESKYWESEVNDIPQGENYGTHAPCNSVRAFRRHLRKHPEINGKAILVSHFKGHNVTA